MGLNFRSKLLRGQISVVSVGAAFLFSVIAPGIAQADSNTIKVDTKKSMIKWTGKKLTGEHSGAVALKSGEVNFKDGMLTGGQFEIDMSSIENMDLEDKKYKAKLETHLKSNDFFAVEDHPTSKFVITDVKSEGNGAYLLNGKLSIKDITHEIQLKANVSKEDGTYRAKSNVTIDRTLWNVRYNSGKFFSLTKLGDKLIYDDISIELDLFTEAASL